MLSLRLDNSTILFMKLVSGVDLRRELTPNLPDSEYRCEYLH